MGKGDADVNTGMAESQVECFSRDKTVQNSKTEGGIERKKNENVKLKKEDVPGAILPREKPEECTVKQIQGYMVSLSWSQNDRKENATRTKVNTRG